jgi:hypothetical protein
MTAWPGLWRCPKRGRGQTPAWLWKVCEQIAPVTVSLCGNIGTLEEWKLKSALERTTPPFQPRETRETGWLPCESPWSVLPSGWLP